MDKNAKVETSDDVVSRSVGGEAVLLNLSSGTYFGLNEVGSAIWELLDKQSLNLAGICDQIEEEFDVTRDQLESDVAALVEKLLENDLLITSSDA
ncbi:hypothetical protein GCM10009127_03230 [Alteraurantiacibacter aestuarii]|uniref:PqqD family peptide modification chaperone n=1 Tax=Alteraurantiacibacter aestuarii TaxID=650004 RepID=A0A844ZLG8_9SPHN|nr:PqqD family protein [Alteraurantiacibacter aestuarii]MXO88423.1 PqqD family peptide modification chaperone [Alteraurantiacibacter aestuarii]